MSKNAPLPQTIPLFPLLGALLLPRMRLPLHVFEPRYLAMIEDCLATKNRLIGMVQPQASPKATQNGGARLSAIGCAGRITSFTETDDGRYMITLTGAARFRILAEEQADTPYRQARVDWSPFARDLGSAESDAGFDRAAFLPLMQRYLAAHRLGSDWPDMGDTDTELLINSLSMLLPFSPHDKQALLEAPSLTTRRETLAALMEFDLRAGKDLGEMLQ